MAEIKDVAVGEQKNLSSCDYFALSRRKCRIINYIGNHLSRGFWPWPMRPAKKGVKHVGLEQTKG